MKELPARHLSKRFRVKSWGNAPSVSHTIAGDADIADASIAPCQHVQAGCAGLPFLFVQNVEVGLKPRSDTTAAGDIAPPLWAAHPIDAQNRVSIIEDGLDKVFVYYGVCHFG